MRKKIKPLILILLFILIILFTLFCLKRRINPFKETKDFIVSRIRGTYKIKGYKAKSLIVVDRKTNDIFISKKEKEKELPASLSKLFVIEYASNILELDEKIKVKSSVLELAKKGSSLANLSTKTYSVHNIYAAMLVPSGNDAAYVLADYIGGKLDKKAKTKEERIRVFIKKLNQYLKKKGYKDTVINDPSGFDLESTTTVLDLKKCVDILLKHEWFREIVSKSLYTAELPDGSFETWKNTNIFLDKSSKHYNEGIIGIKTGSLNKEYNLVVLYKKNNREFLICSLGSTTNDLRYEDVEYIIESIDNSSKYKSRSQ